MRYQCSAGELLANYALVYHSSKMLLQCNLPSLKGLNRLSYTYHVPDVFGIAGVELLTYDDQLTEVHDTPFSLRVTVTCTTPSCHVPRAAENVAFSLVSHPDTSCTYPYELAEVRQGPSTYHVHPSLGSGYFYTGHSRDFTIQGTARVGAHVIVL